MYLYLREAESRAESGSEESVLRAYAEYMSETRAFGVEAGELPKIVRSGRGKPYFGDDSFPHFSVSHSGAMWLCLMADFRVGVDIQERIAEGAAEERRTGKLARRFFTADERAYADIYGAEAFYRLWTRKESLVKFLDAGFFELFEGLSLLDENGDLKREIRMDGRRIYLGEIEVGRDIYCSYAAEKEEEICLRLLP